MQRVRQDHYEAPDQKKRQEETCLTSRRRSSKFQDRKRRSLKMMDRAHSRSGVLSASMLDMAHELRLGRLQGVPEIHAGWVCGCVCFTNFSFIVTESKKQAACTSSSAELHDVKILRIQSLVAGDTLPFRWLRDPSLAVERCPEQIVNVSVSQTKRTTASHSRQWTEQVEHVPVHLIR